MPAIHRISAMAIILIAALLPLAAWQQRASAQTSGRMLVATSTTVFVDMIQRVGGDRVEAFSIVPAGTDVHTFQPAPQDIQRASRAKVAVWNGLGLDQRAEEAVAGLNVPGLTTLTLSDRLEPIVSSEDEDAHAEEGDEHAGANPHLWLDLTLAMRYVEQIRDGLAAADPQNAAIYQANADRYLAELAELDTWSRGEVATIPPARRKLVTFHDAFPYLARHLGLDLVGVVLKSPGREPSAREVAELVTEIKALQVPTVYAEPQFNARILELAARDAGVGVRTLYSDALDDQVTSYTDLMRYNVNSLVEGLR